METFEFVVTSIARVALKEHIKIQAENVEDAITRIEDNDYYEEDGDVLSREYELIEILQKYDRDREVTIHTLKGETVEVNGYFVQRDLNDNAFYLTDLDVVPND